MCVCVAFTCVISIVTAYFRRPPEPTGISTPPYLKNAKGSALVIWLKHEFRAATFEKDYCNLESCEQIGTEEGALKAGPQKGWFFKLPRNNIAKQFTKLQDLAIKPRDFKRWRADS